MGIPANITATVPDCSDSGSGQVTDVWHAVDGVRVEVRFPKMVAPSLAVGRAGELRFERRTASSSVTALGKVAYRNEGDGERTYHFIFGDRTRQALSALLEPRRAHRVYPDEDAPVAITVIAPGVDGAMIGPARDVSASGIGVEIPWEHEAALAPLDVVMVRLRLPGADQELEFAGRIRNRSLGKGAILYGIEFDLGDTQSGVGHDARIAALRTYVTLRTSKLAREESRMRRSA